MDDVRVEGEAMVYFRKGRHVPCFDYSINAPWRVRLTHGELVTGHLEVPELTNACGEVPEDLEVRVPYARDWHCSPATAQGVLSFMRGEGSAALREALRASEAVIREAALAPPEAPGRSSPDLQRIMREAMSREAAAGRSLA
mmetsp:Transcript_63650/g.197104  ORF Transcript_63650/g.197104 Transcript_63650/m.197104 type:complete len:142 (-) Transcript_63650:15-440(-)